jgi:hypothetical protein
MAKIFAACPVTGQPVDTGIGIDDDTFRRIHNVVGKMHCPHCMTDHEWTKAEAWVSEDGRREP